MKTSSATNVLPEATKAAQAAAKFFARATIHTLAVIGTEEDTKMADVSVFTRDGGLQIAVLLPTAAGPDYLEWGADKLAYRFGSRPAVIYADQELSRAE